MGRQPVDHGWAWVICLGTAVQSFFVIGGLKSMGILFVELLELFDVPGSITALTLGFLAGGFALCAMLSNALTVMFGIRPVIMFGSMLFTLSIFMAMFPVNIWYLIMVMGLLTGISFTFMFTPSVLLVGHYFDKRIGLANGVSFVGSSIGQLCLPYLITYLVKEYGYRGAMLIYTGISMHSLAAALLMRPVSFWGKGTSRPQPQRDASVRVEVTENGTLDVELRGVCGGDAAKAASLTEDRHSLIQDDTAEKPLPGSTHSLPGSNNHLRGSNNSLSGSNHSLRASNHSIHLLPKDIAVSQNPSHGRNDQDRLTDSPVRSRTNTLTLRPGLSVESLAVIHQDIEVATDAHPAANQKKQFLCLKIRPITCLQIWRLMFDPDLVRSPSLWVIFLSLGLGHAGFLSALLHLPVLAVELFGDKYMGAMLIAIAGVFDIFGRLGGGWFADLGYVTRANMSAAAFAITGATTIVAMFYPVLPVLITYCVVMGLVGGIYRILLPVIVGDVFGKAKLGPGIGMLFMSLGLLAVPVPSLLGYMQFKFGSYVPAIQFCGGLLLFGSGLLFTLPLFRNCDKAVIKTPKEPQEEEDAVDV